jgi:hypothetical protein
MTQTQFNTILLGLFATGGPLSKIILALCTACSGQTIAAFSDLLTLLTPAIAGYIYYRWMSPKNQVQRVADELTPQQQNDALSGVSDAAKVKIAASVPDVAHIAVSDSATDGLAAAAASPLQPKVVTLASVEANK